MGTGRGDRRVGFEHRGERDLVLLGRLGGRSGVTRSAVRSDPTAVAQLLADPATLRAVSAS